MTRVTKIAFIDFTCGKESNLVSWLQLCLRMCQCWMMQPLLQRTLQLSYSIFLVGKYFLCLCALPDSALEWQLLAGTQATTPLSLEPCYWGIVKTVINMS